MIRIIGAVCLAAAMAAGSVCAAEKAKDQPAPAPIILNRGLSGNPGTLDPHKAETVAEATVVGDLFVGLVADDASGRPVPGCAESWTVSPDGLTYTFKLRDGLTWSDGKPLTSADFVYSFRRALDPSTAAPQAGLLYIVKNAEAVNKGTLPPDMLGVSAGDPRTVEIALDAPAPYFLEILTNPIAYPVPSHVINTVGRDWVKPGTMVVNGPFLLASRSAAGPIQLSRNPKFYDADTIRLDDVIYVPTEDDGGAVSQFRAGDLDIVNRVPMTRLAWLRDNMPKALHLAPSLAVYYLALNTSRPPLADAKLRLALSYAIDRKTLASKLLDTGAIPAEGLVPPGTANYSETYQPDYAELSMPQRLGKARQLIQQAGYGPNHPLELTIRYVAGDEREKVAVAIASMWRRAGVVTKFQSAESKVNFSAVRAGDFTVAYEGWQADYNDAGDFLYLLRTGANSTNTSRYSNPAFDKLMAQADQAASAADRATILKQAEALAMKDQPVIPLFFLVSANLVASYVEGWQDNPLNIHRSRYLWLDAPQKNTPDDTQQPPQDSG